MLYLQWFMMRKYEKTGLFCQSQEKRLHDLTIERFNKNRRFLSRNLLRNDNSNHLI